VAESWPRQKGERIGGRAARHLGPISPRVKATTRHRSLVRNHIPSALLPLGWRIIGGECARRRRIFGFCEFVGRERKERGEITAGVGREIRCVNGNVCLLPSAFSRLSYRFLMLLPRREVPDHCYIEQYRPTREEYAC
jgi:hypothetical protein